MSTRQQKQGAFNTLRRFVGKQGPLEHCDLCNVELPPEHQHLIELETRRMVCACEPCAILFSGNESARYRRVPRRIRALPEFEMSDAQWSDLQIPIGMAFLFESSAAGRVVAFYPGPAGATESLLDLRGWNKLVERNPLLARMEPDVEALLVNRVGQTREYFVVPIDECYKLVGLIRQSWRGLSGGSEAWEQIGQFFGSLRARS